MHEWIVWLIIVVLLFLIEIMTINITTIWFVISGIIALITSIFIDNFIIQFSAFVILGILLLLIAKPYLTKYLKDHNLPIITKKMDKNNK
ncbi:MAG: hypothetical protein IKG27_03550 [Bacilli bacterium]|nr:hypothetical protein [Bacilli bacterium]